MSYDKSWFDAQRKQYSSVQTQIEKLFNEVAESTDTVQKLQKLQNIIDVVRSAKEEAKSALEKEGLPIADAFRLIKFVPEAKRQAASLDVSYNRAVSMADKIMQENNLINPVRTTQPRESKNAP